MREAYMLLAVRAPSKYFESLIRVVYCGYDKRLT